MFSFFIDNTFFDFWANKQGDIFTDLTIEKMGWPNEQVSLNFYAGIPVARPEYFTFDENKNLVIQDKIITLQGDIEVEEMVTINTIAPIAYVINGEKILPC